MDIKNIVTQNDKRYGLIIDLGNGEELFTKMEGLHVEMILDGIAESGWRLYGLPYDVRNDDGRTLDDVETIDKANANITEEDEERAYDLAAEQMLKDDLAKKIYVPAKKAINFLPSTNDIQTREGLIEYLELLENADMRRQGTIVNYMPLNSFVAKEALFTVEEYFAPENAKYRRIIEERRVLSYQNYLKLVKQLQDFAGLPKTFNNKDLADAYFKWGICGINTEFYNISKTESSISIDSYDFTGTEKQRPRVTMTVPTYITAQGDIIRSKNTTSSDWKVLDDAQAVKIKRTRLEELGDEYIDIVRLTSVVNEERTVMDGKELNVEYNGYRMLLRRNSFSVTAVPAIQVKDPTSPSDVMSPSFVGNKTSAGMNLDEYMICKSIALSMIARKTVNTTGSTFKALTLIGCTPLAMIKLLLNDEGNLETFNDSLNELTTISSEEAKSNGKDKNSLTSFEAIELVETYLAGQLSDTDPKYNSVKYLVEDLIDGNMNYDMILEGENADASTAVLDTYINYVYGAHKFLDLSYIDIIKEIEKLNINDDSDLVFIGNNGLKLAVTIHNFNNKKEAYVAQVNEYTKRQASPFASSSGLEEGGKRILKLYSYVESVTLELAGRKSAKYHAAAELYMVDLTEKGAKDKTVPLIKEIDAVMIPAIKERTYDTRSGRQQANDAYSILYANAIISIARTGKYTMPEEWGSETIQPSRENVEILRMYVKRRYESLALICEKMCAYNGNMMHYIVNAVVTPKIVIPRKGWPAIPVRPFIPNWVNTGMKGLEEQRYDWYSKGFFGDGLVDKTNNTPEMLEKHGGNPNHIGWESMYDNVGFRDCHGSVAGLHNYYETAQRLKNETPEGKLLVNVPTPVELIYGDLYGTRPLYKDRKPEEANLSNVIAIQKTKQVTYEDVVNSFEEVRELLEPDVIELP